MEVNSTPFHSLVLVWLTAVCVTQPFGAMSVIRHSRHGSATWLKKRASVCVIGSPNPDMRFGFLVRRLCQPRKVRFHLPNSECPNAARLPRSAPRPPPLSKMRAVSHECATETGTLPDLWSTKAKRAHESSRRCYPAASQEQQNGVPKRFLHLRCYKVLWITINEGFPRRDHARRNQYPIGAPPAPCRRH
ncbi:hypothetical protein K505DRAFT_3290 [Melanomma pulvis-pyrius CBS 109.77]|uniref:Secreted protein n=1 Tax=Melanomma pulvis-pyrius CBS 109.77 TaxID=1314802 RepID=A0A6A6XI79_9PLEO|nr:hypothetical protein K505DRAFT_3290 [Melanomma pulvis-pyrius CBS 109.77]